ncbi:hypothetical protein BJ138DRAFT_1069361 [Hygrophoropsis aurantiaca]|uniref:Uncharacterized protein n=1 Tax=Hygrophoropsis aurantiaca TaxID=72124 RepID=A0ACB8A528_9AGAM|nr:hypothetical protein BJ138DRAFT_1069361 [Hygrophoropsis aurantiaca]
MGVFYDQIPDHLVDWINKQQIFWVASAPLTGNGHVNVSPKATPNCFHMVSPNRVWYEDLTGSGIETISHIREPGNGRVTILFHSMEGPPRILRFWGKGSVHEFGTPEYDEYIPREKRKPGSRAVVVIDIFKVGTSCGFGVPVFKFEAHRTQLERWCDSLEEFDRKNAASDAPSEEHPPKGIKAWWTVENLKSHDGLPGLRVAHNTETLPTNGFDRHAPRPKIRKLDGPSTVQSLSKGIWADVGKVVVAFTMGVMVTAAYVRAGGLKEALY